MLYHRPVRVKVIILTSKIKLKHHSLLLLTRF